MTDVNEDHPIKLWLKKKRAMNGKISIFEIPLPLLCGEEMSTNPSSSNITDELTTSTEEIAQPNMTSFKCRICKEVFASHKLQQLHFKSESHVSKVRATLSDADRSLASSNALSLSDEDENTNSSDEDGESSDCDSDEDVESTSTTYETYDYYSDVSMSNSVTEEGTVRKENTMNGGLLLVFKKKIFDFEYGVSAAVFGVGQRGKDGREGFLSSRDLSDVNPWEIIANSIYYLQANPYSCVLCLRSGRFAAAVFCGPDIVAHKTFRRYTVRAKAGGAQSSHDKSSGHARSMGANLRRYGEQALRDDIHKLLIEWKKLLDVCAVVLVAVPRNMRSRYIYNADVRDFPLSKDDKRIRDIPFSINTPTFEGVKLAHSKCMSISFRDRFEGHASYGYHTGTRIQASGEPLPAISESNEEKNSRKEEHADEETTKATTKEDVQHILSLPTELQVCLDELTNLCAENCDVAAVKESIDRMAYAVDALQDTSTDDNQAVLQDVPELTSHMMAISMEDVLNSPLSVDTLDTLLHRAAAGGKSKVVMALLQRGCSPCCRDIRGRLPYFLSKDKETRDAFRRYRAEAEDAYDWDQQTGVPSALTDDMLKAQKEKEKEKKKRARQKKKDEKKYQEEEAKIAAEAKAAEEAKKRTSCGNCDTCNKSLYRSEMFEVFDRKCCSSTCVVLCRRKLMAEAAEKRMKGK